MRQMVVSLSPVRFSTAGFRTMLSLVAVACVASDFLIVSHPFNSGYEM